MTTNRVAVHIADCIGRLPPSRSSALRTEQRVSHRSYEPGKLVPRVTLHLSPFETASVPVATMATIPKQPTLLLPPRWLCSSVGGCAIMTAFVNQNPFQSDI
jgi:hypothetical protein